LLVIPP